MMGRRRHRHSLLDAIHQDEVGLEFGIMARQRFKTLFQPVYGRVGAELAPAMLRAGCEAIADPLVAEIPGLVLPDATPEATSRLGLLLATRNYRNADARGLKLYLQVPARSYPRLGAFEADIRHLARQVDDLEIDPAQVICELSCRSGEFDTSLKMASILRRRGVKIALAHSKPDDPLSFWMARLRPDHVRIDGDWFVKICGHHVSRSLLTGLVRAMRDNGSTVLIEKLDSRRLLDSALEAGADFLQGDSLQAAGLVGTLIDPAPVPLPGAAEKSNILPIRPPARTYQGR